MLCNRALGNVRYLPRDKREDLVDFAWHECATRAQRKTSREGREAVILLSPGERLAHGDVLFEFHESRVVVEVAPCEVLVARPACLHDMGRLALELGNLHAPAQIAGEELLVIPDGPVEQALERLGIPYRAEVRRFAPDPVTVGGVGVAQGFEVVRRGPSVARGERG